MRKNQIFSEIFEYGSSSSLEGTIVLLKKEYTVQEKFGFDISEGLNQHKMALSLKNEVQPQTRSHTPTNILQKNFFNAVKVVQRNNRGEGEIYYLECNVFMGTRTKSENWILNDEKIQIHCTNRQ